MNIRLELVSVLWDGELNFVRPLKPSYLVITWPFLIGYHLRSLNWWRIRWRGGSMRRGRRKRRRKRRRRRKKREFKDYCLSIIVSTAMIKEIFFN